MEHFKGHATSWQKHGELAHQLATGIALSQPMSKGYAGYVEVAGSTKKKMMEASPQFGPRGSYVRLLMERFKSPDPKVTGYKLRLELNPRKLGIQGGKELLNYIEMTADTPFDFAAFLSDAWVTSLHVAVDFADLRPSDLIVTLQDQGKVVRYSGDDGVLETVQAHAKKAQPKAPKQVIKNPLGPLIVRVYDRNREREAHGKPVPYVGRQVTRVERVLRKKQSAAGSGFTQLFSHADPFKPVRLSTIGAAKPALISKVVWRSFCALASIVGPAEALAITCKTPAETKAVAAAFAGHPSHLLGSELWAGWKAGMATTGLDYLVQKAIAAAWVQG